MEYALFCVTLVTLSSSLACLVGILNRKWKISDDEYARVKKIDEVNIITTQQAILVIPYAISYVSGHQSRSLKMFTMGIIASLSVHMTYHLTSIYRTLRIYERKRVITLDANGSVDYSN